jgi:hypothetical protein
MGTHNIVLRQNNRSETPPSTDDANKFNIITFPRSANAFPFSDILNIENSRLQMFMDRKQPSFFFFDLQYDIYINIRISVLSKQRPPRSCCLNQLLRLVYYPQALVQNILFGSAVNIFP